MENQLETSLSGQHFESDSAQENKPPQDHDLQQEGTIRFLLHSALLNWWTEIIRSWGLGESKQYSFILSDFSLSVYSTFKQSLLV